MFAANRRMFVLGAHASAGITDLGSGDRGKCVDEAAWAWIYVPPG